MVIGAGVMGAATAWALSTSGRSILLLEQFELGHDRGSSHGTSRLFRFSYPEETYVAMARESLPLWRRLESEAGQPLLLETGGFDCGPDIARHAAALKAQGLDFQMLEGSDATSRWPMLRFPEEPVLFQPGAAVIAADAVLQAFVQVGAGKGVRVSVGERVTAIDPRPDSAVVTTERGVIEAGAVVVTAGAWARGLLATAGIDLAVRVTRETICYFAAHDQGLPALVEWSEPTRYALGAPGVGIKAGEHIAGPAANPDDRGRPDPAAVARLAAWVGERYPEVDPAPLTPETCLYTNTADQSFVLERHGPVIVGSPCSGHGFKFAPLIGTRLASLALD